jgi:hypothetical protein
VKQHAKEIRIQMSKNGHHVMLLWINNKASNLIVNMNLNMKKIWKIDAMYIDKN